MAARWSEYQKNLVANAAGVLTPESIAQGVNKSVSAVQNYARKAGISLAIKRKPWTFSEDEILMHKTALGVTASKVASQLERSVKSVRGRIAYLRERDAEN